jgi:hypothetical protein
MAYLVAARVVGEWLSLVEHLVRDQGVGGSNPLSPTISFQQFTIESRSKNANPLVTHQGVNFIFARLYFQRLNGSTFTNEGEMPANQHRVYIKEFTFFTLISH